MMTTHPNWWFDEFQHLGVDFDSVEQVESYSQKQGTLPEEERALIARLCIGAQHRLLEFGCGTGIFAIEAAKVCQHVYAVDISKTMLAYVSRAAEIAGVSNLTTIHSGFLGYRHEGEPLDYIVTKYAFHHLPDFWKSAALDRMRLMLKPGGKLYIEDVIFSFAPTDYRQGIDGWINRMVKPDEQTFSKGDFEMHVREEHSTFTWIIEGLLQQNGFEIVEKQITSPEYANYTAVRG